KSNVAKAEFAAELSLNSASCREALDNFFPAILIESFRGNRLNRSLRGPSVLTMIAPIKPAAACATLAAALDVSLIFVSSGFAQETAAPGTVEAERVTVTGESAISTGSLIPSWEVA